MNYNQNDIGEKLTLKYGGRSSALATGTGDNTKVTGKTIDTLGFDSGMFTALVNTTLASGESLDVAIEYQFSANNSDWDTAVEFYDDTLVTATGAAITAGGYIITENFNLQPQKRYIRFNFTPDLSAAGTDVAYAQWGLVLGGYYENPI